MEKLSLIQQSNLKFLLAFSLLSIADLQFTQVLLARGSVFEANPLAALFIDNLPAYKTACVCIVISCLATASLKRPFLVNRVCKFGAALTGVVVLYSLALLIFV